MHTHNNLYFSLRLINKQLLFILLENFPKNHKLIFELKNNQGKTQSEQMPKNGTNKISN